jgi:hypothetical protein
MLSFEIIIPTSIEDNQIVPVLFHYVKFDGEPIIEIMAIRVMKEETGKPM